MVAEIHSIPVADVRESAITTSRNNYDNRGAHVGYIERDEVLELAAQHQATYPESPATQQQIEAMSTEARKRERKERSIKNAPIQTHAATYRGSGQKLTDRTLRPSKENKKFAGYIINFQTGDMLEARLGSDGIAREIYGEKSYAELKQEWEKELRDQLVALWWKDKQTNIKVTKLVGSISRIPENMWAHTQLMSCMQTRGKNPESFTKSAKSIINALPVSTIANLIGEA